MDNAQRSKLLNKAVDLLNEADALVQQALGADDECYYIATQIQNAADDVTDIIVACDDNRCLIIF
jgi:hypothetical protein